MKIGFKPQSLVKNIVSEHFVDNSTLNRIIEIPAKSGKPERVLDITYKKADFVPTEWYVANYNLFSRDGKNVVKKTLSSQKAHPNEIHTVVTTYGTNGYGKQVTLDIANGQAFRIDKTIKK